VPATTAADFALQRERETVREEGIVGDSGGGTAGNRDSRGAGRAVSGASLDERASHDDKRSIEMLAAIALAAATVSAVVLDALTGPVGSTGRS